MIRLRPIGPFICECGELATADFITYGCIYDPGLHVICEGCCSKGYDRQQEGL